MNSPGIPNPQLIKAAVTDAWQGFSESNSKVCIVVDLTQVPAPEAKEARVHTGLHPYFFSTLAKSTFFDKPLEIIYDNVCAAVKAHASEFTILCVDKEGIWTSMTFAKIVAEIAVSCRQFLLQGVTVLTPTDAFPCSQCDRCKFWDRRWVAKHEGINHAIQKWEGLMQGKRLCK